MKTISLAQTHRGVVRIHNEDAFLEMPESGIWVVADGMGGHEAGDIASQLVIDTIERAVARTPLSQMNCSVIISAIEQSNAKLQHMRNTRFSGNITGSTVVVLWISGDCYHYFWAGDSRGYLLRNNQLIQVTKDHSQVNDMVDEGIISAAQAESHPLANVITRAVGVDTTIDVDVVSNTINCGDVFLLCSDGLNKEVNDKEIEATLLSGNVIDACMALMHASLVRNARDNVTCILIKNQHSANSKISYNEDKTIPLIKIHTKK